MHTLLEAEKEVMGETNRVKELLTVRRNRNAMIASEIVMFMQQFWYVSHQRKTELRVWGKTHLLRRGYLLTT